MQAVSVFSLSSVYKRPRKVMHEMYGSLCTKITYPSNPKQSDVLYKLNIGLQQNSAVCRIMEEYDLRISADHSSIHSFITEIYIASLQGYYIQKRCQPLHG